MVVSGLRKGMREHRNLEEVIQGFECEHCREPACPGLAIGTATAGKIFPPKAEWET
jgi:hypothetical protein